MISKMNLINYPTKGFLSACQHLISDGEALRIIIVSGWREARIKQLLPFFEEDNVIAESHLSDYKGKVVSRKVSTAYVLSMLLLPSFFYVHTYALSHGYRFSANEQDGVLYIDYKFEPASVARME